MYDVNEKLSKNFSLGEFLHNEDVRNLTPTAYLNIKTKLVPALEWVRTKCGGRPVRVHSGYRSWIHQLNVYRDLARAAGKPFDISIVPRQSWHLQGGAADITIDGLTPDQVRNIIKDYSMGMELGTPYHVHLDVRQAPPFRFFAKE